MHPRIPTYDDILAARDRIAPHVTLTPVIENPILNLRAGGRVFLKAECLQRIGAFKFRGAFNKVSQIDAKAYPGGVVALSSGNHAQGVAEAAHLLNISARIVMPNDAPQMKIARTRRSGAEVVLYDRDKEDREEIAHALCVAHKAALVHPFDDPDIIAGQGTCGVEMIEQIKARGLAPDLVLVCASGGGFVSGMALAVKHAHPAAEIYSVEPEDFDDFKRSLISGKHERNATKSGSICDALMSQTPGQMTLAIGKIHLKGGLAVSDADVRRAVKFAFEELKLVVEPGGAAALAAILSGRIDCTGRVVAAVLSGGNVDPQLYAQLIA